MKKPIPAPAAFPAAEQPAPESRWPVIIATLSTTGLYYSLPERLTPGPTWVVAALMLVLTGLTAAAYRLRRHSLNRALGILLLTVSTTGVVWSLANLIAGLPKKSEQPIELLRAAVALWTSNVLVFAGWYWRLDAGGPHRRDLRNQHQEGAFLFPQMMLPDSKMDKAWKPGFVDYLFLAFNTSTAFSPTDVPVLSRWAKLLMMLQSSISLSTIAILAARAINIL